jgi:hypothetical protein
VSFRGLPDYYVKYICLRVVVCPHLTSIHLLFRALLNKVVDRRNIYNGHDPNYIPFYRVNNY